MFKRFSKITLTTRLAYIEKRQDDLELKLIRLASEVRNLRI